MKQKKRFSGWSVMISVCMVLFVLGLFGMLIINSEKLTNYLRENVLVIVYFDTQISDEILSERNAEIIEFDYVKSAKYITAEQAAFDYKEILGKDFIEVLGSNPLPASIEVKLDATKIPENLEDILEVFGKIEGVSVVDYQEDIVLQINKNKKVVGIVMIAVALLLLIISLVLINNTIRLDVYARRFVVKSMQLVGATEWFIIRPFMVKSLVLTLISTCLAFGLVIVCNVLLTNWVETYGFEVSSIFKSDITIYSILFAIITVLGLCIVLPSTYFATKKYLRLRINELY